MKPFERFFYDFSLTSSDFFFKAKKSYADLPISRMYEPG
jgi:hypothetical protein